MKQFSDKIILSGHRGERTVVPENTMAAFRYALECGVDMIETDFHLSGDRHLVLIHDHTLDRTTDGAGFVRDCTLEELRALSAGVKFSEDYREERIPTAEEFFALTADKDILFNLEFKVYPADEGERAFEQAEKLVAMLKEFGIADERVMFNSWSVVLLQYMRRRYGNRFQLHGYYPLELFNDTCEGDLFAYMDWACLFPTADCPARVRPREDYEIVKARGVKPCDHMPAVYTDYARAVGNGTRMFTVDDIRTSDCILRALGVR
ncbi:MAG TPA: hypothetical protein IAB32_06260 [Candidatus Scatosoma pullicola]|nr:hypothetical protein [Candidatus Scatosoma pullicola]